MPDIWTRCPAKLKGRISDLTDIQSIPKKYQGKTGKIKRNEKNRGGGEAKREKKHSEEMGKKVKKKGK